MADRDPLHHMSIIAGRINYLTDEYTVVCWDERGCGRSYYRNVNIDPDNETLSFDAQLADLDALVDYLCERFSQDQVIIIGHSYGTMLGSRYVLAHPEKVSAYIGIGQSVNTRNYSDEIYSYEDALAKARANGDGYKRCLNHGGTYQSHPRSG